MAKFRKKPVVIDAIQYKRGENIMLVQDFFGAENGSLLKFDENLNEYYIATLEGKMHLTHGDWIIKGVQGEFYPCKPDIFEQTYEPA